MKNTEPNIEEIPEPQVEEKEATEKTDEQSEKGESKAGE